MENLRIAYFFTGLNANSIMLFFRTFSRFFLNSFLQNEKDKIQNKFDKCDERLDRLEKDVAVNTANLSGLSLAFFSHIEALEASINGIKASQEALNMVSSIQYKHLEDTLDELKSVIRAVSK